MNKEWVDSKYFDVEFISNAGNKWLIKTSLDEKISNLIEKFINKAGIDRVKLKDLSFLFNAIRLPYD